MEILIVVFLGAWVTVCSLAAWRKVKKDLRDVTGSGRENEKR